LGGKIIESILVLAVFALGLYVNSLLQRLKSAEGRISDMSDTLDILLSRLPKTRKQKAAIQDSEPEEEPEFPRSAMALKQSDPDATKNRAVATIVGSNRSSADAATLTHDEDTDTSRAEPAASGFARNTQSWQINFEDLVGGKLPIWIGGIALVFAAFFLVRYSIEAGLLGPTARSIIAAVFGISLIGFSEYGGLLPKVGASFKADRRIGQSLAGAGVAILYGTLYMASEIYGLVGVGTAFVLVLAVTAAAFALSLRQGPPTALMGIAGGFAAPWVAGMGAQNMPALLLYLAVFIAAVFGLAVWRRWLWLLVLASGGGLIWTLYLLAFAELDLPLLGLFIMASGIGALVAFDRFEEQDEPHNKIWAEAARYVPIAAAMLQLLLLLPKMDFSISGWLFFGTLCALTVVLGWRDRKMLPLTCGAFALLLTTIGSGWLAKEYVSGKLDYTSIIASIVAFLVFGGPALLKSFQKADSESRHDNLIWNLLTASAAPTLWTIAATFGSHNFSDVGMAMIAIAAALPCAWLAWYHRSDGMTPAWLGLFANSAAAIFLLTMAAILFANENWIAAAFAFGALLAAAWASRVEGKAVARIAIAPLALAILAGLVLNYKMLNMLGASLAGEKAFFTSASTIAETAIKALVPALMVLALCWTRYFATGRRTRIVAQIAGGIGVGAMAYLLIKQPLAIGTDARFITAGFGERMAITHLLALAGWLALHFGKALPRWPSLKPVGLVLGGLALARFVYFDLAVLNPTMVVQNLGALPLLNLGTLHCALAAVWTWAYGRASDETRLQTPLYIGGLLAMVLTVLITVRQLSLGSIISGERMGSGENYLYSACLMALAILWLVRAMTGAAQKYDRLLRISGLLLITVVTFKVFLIDAAALTGVLRILSFLGLGIALIAIGWGYGKVMGQGKAGNADDPAV
jgi:uncharacterized membrane protein